MNRLRITLTFLFLATSSLCLAEEELKECRDATHPILQPLEDLAGTFEDASKAIVHQILEPFDIAFPETWQNEQVLLGYGLNFRNLQALIEDTPADQDELVAANVGEALSLQAFEDLQAEGDQADIKTKVVQSLALLRGTILAALRTDIVRQVAVHDFTTPKIEFKINKILLTSSLDSIRVHLEDLTRVLKVDLSEDAQAFNKDLNADLEVFGSIFLPQVLDVVSLLTDPARFLVAQMVYLVATVDPTDLATQETLVKLIGHNLASLVAEFGKASKQAEQFVLFCVKLLRSHKTDDHFQHFLTRVSLAVFQEAHLLDQSRDFCLLPLFGQDSEPFPAMTTEHVAFLNNFFEKYGRIHSEMQDTWTNIKIAEGCAGSFLAHNHEEIKRALARFPDFQRNRAGLLEMFARTSLLLATDLAPLTPNRTPDFMGLFHAVLYRAEAIKSDKAHEPLPWFEATVDGKTINQKLDNAYATGALGLTEYVVGKIVNAVVSAALKEASFALRLKVASDDSSLPALIAYVTANIKMADLLRKLAAAQAKKTNLDFAHESPADVLAFSFTQEFSSDDFNFGQVDLQTKKFFVSAQPEVARQLTIAVDNQDLREDVSYDLSEDSFEQEGFEMRSLEDLKADKENLALIQQALNVAGPAAFDAIIGDSVFEEDM